MHVILVFIRNQASLTSKSMVRQRKSSTVLLMDARNHPTEGSPSNTHVVMSTDKEINRNIRQNVLTNRIILSTNKLLFRAAAVFNCLI